MSSIFDPVVGELKATLGRTQKGKARLRTKHGRSETKRGNRCTKEVTILLEALTQASLLSSEVLTAQEALVDATDAVCGGKLDPRFARGKSRDIAKRLKELAELRRKLDKARKAADTAFDELAKEAEITGRKLAPVAAEAPPEEPLDQAATGPAQSQ